MTSKQRKGSLSRAVPIFRAYGLSRYKQQKKKGKNPSILKNLKEKKNDQKKEPGTLKKGKRIAMESFPDGVKK
ncbi:MAG: hypothetical protein MI742_14685 [Desulfobacterales bacterium]|nr:hypothetical protein [Desulfobacterales bacterium]